MKKDEWIGIPEERFRAYRQWTTPQGYLCGTHAAAVLLAYYQDYLDETVIPTYIRQKNSRQSKALVKFLQLFIQRYGLPTVAWQVAHGLSGYFDYTDKNYVLV